MFSTPADLGIVAYALVRPSNGPGGAGVGDTSELNSGVTANWSGTGVCDITLPGDPTQQEPLQLGQGTPLGPPRDLILITPCYTGQPVYYCVNDVSPFDKRVFFYDYTGSLVSVSFTIIILRSLISPPQDDQGNYIAPA